MTSESYHFGTQLAVRCDYFAFPRTGSHYLWACLTGLLDLVFYPNEFVDNPEARQRVEELNPHAYYVLRLRKDGVPYQPVYLDASANGTHGLPVATNWPRLILIRDPHASIFSWYYTAIERWGAEFPDRIAWLKEAYQHYANFYRAALALQQQDPERTCLVRFETLKDDAAELDRIVAFLGVRPKLAPGFVHWWTQFDRITQPGKRTFYRGGDNRRWRDDAAWLADLRQAAPGDFAEFGYPGQPC